MTAAGLAPCALLGREADRERIVSALRSNRVVTVVGPGGIGKTSLAREIAASFPSPVVCDLANAKTAADLIAAAANAMGIATSGTAEAACEQVTAALEARAPSLLLLDNLERVADAEPLLERWSTRGLTLLCTSRRRLELRFALDLELQPLAVEAALQLFLSRARQRAPELPADEWTTQLVQRLEGNPLALELAAARAHVLPPRALLERLSRSLDVLRSSTLPARHRSLRAVVEDSFSLCSPEDQAALLGLSVFSGTFSLSAADAVLASDADERIQSLLSWFMLQRASSKTGEPRFTMLDSVRELAYESLQRDLALRSASVERHARYFGALARTTQQAVERGDLEVLSSLEPDLENFVTALSTTGDAALALDLLLQRSSISTERHSALLIAARSAAAPDSLAGAELEAALARVLRRSGDSVAASEQAMRAAALASRLGHTALTAEALLTASGAVFDRGNLQQAQQLGEQAHAEAQRANAVELLCRAEAAMGSIALARGALPEASRWAERAIGNAKRSGFRLVEFMGENLLAGVCSRRGSVGEAEQRLRRAQQILQELGLTSLESVVLGNLAKVMVVSGRDRDARETAARALEQSRRYGLQSCEATQLVLLAIVEAQAGNRSGARDLAVQAELLAERISHARTRFFAGYVLGCIALEDQRYEEAEAAFARASSAAQADAAASLRVAAAAGMVVSKRQSPALAFAQLDELEQHATSDLARAALAVRRAQLAGEPLPEIGAVRSVELHLTLWKTSLATTSPPPSIRPTAQEQLPAQMLLQRTTRGGTEPAVLPASFAEYDLAYNALAREVHCQGAQVLDLKRKPIAARLLEVLLATPNEPQEKTSLFRSVWHQEFRDLSQGAAIYKAVDRLVHLLDPNPRRFLCWDEAGRLVVVAKNPALFVVPGRNQPSLPGTERN